MLSCSRQDLGVWSQAHLDWNPGSAAPSALNLLVFLSYKVWSWRSNQSVLKEINLEYSLEELILKLRYFAHLMRRADSLETTLKLGRLRAGGEGNDRGWEGWMVSPTQWPWVWASSGRLWRETWSAAIHGVTKSHILLSNWTTCKVLFWNNFRLINKLGKIIEEFPYSFQQAAPSSNTLYTHGTISNTKKLPLVWDS